MVFFSLIDCIPYQFGLDFYSHYLFSVSLSYYLQSDGYIVNPLKGEQTLHQDFLMLYRIFSMVIDISNIPGIYGIYIYRKWYTAYPPPHKIPIWQPIGTCLYNDV